MPSDVKASNMLDNIRFCVAFTTKYNPNVTRAAKTKLKTKNKIDKLVYLYGEYAVRT